MADAPLEVAIFSYNRGTYLEHCVGSVRRNMPFARIRVFDDRSDDPETVAYLKTLGDAVHIRDGGETARLGGLYANMQSAVDNCKAPYVMFLQDDMQIVRPVDTVDLQTFDHFFADHRKAAFITPLFQKAHRRRSRQRYLRPAPGHRGYLFDMPSDAEGRLVDRFYNDVTIADVARLRAAKWHFTPVERENAAQAQSLFSEMLFLGDPFAFFCLSPPTYRYRATTWASRRAHAVFGDQVKGFHDLSQEELTRLRARPIDQIAYAEDWLRPTVENVRKPYVFKAVNERWHWRALNKIELALRGLN